MQHNVSRTERHKSTNSCPGLRGCCFFLSTCGKVSIFVRYLKPELLTWQHMFAYVGLDDDALRYVEELCLLASNSSNVTRCQWTAATAATDHIHKFRLNASLPASKPCVFPPIAAAVASPSAGKPSTVATFPRAYRTSQSTYNTRL